MKYKRCYAIALGALLTACGGHTTDSENTAQTGQPTDPAGSAAPPSSAPPAASSDMAPADAHCPIVASVAELSGTYTCADVLVATPGGETMALTVEANDQGVSLKGPPSGALQFPWYEGTCRAKSSANDGVLFVSKSATSKPSMTWMALPHLWTCEPTGAGGAP